MGALNNKEYNICWEPTDGAGGPDENGNISNARHWLKKVLFEQWSITKDHYDNVMNDEQRERFCDVTQIEDIAFKRNDRQSANTAVEILMDQKEERALKKFLTDLFYELGGSED